MLKQSLSKIFALLNHQILLPPQCRHVNHHDLNHLWRVIVVNIIMISIFSMISIISMISIFSMISVFSMISIFSVISIIIIYSLSFVPIPRFPANLAPPRFYSTWMFTILMVIKVMMIMIVMGLIIWWLCNIDIDENHCDTSGHSDLLCWPLAWWKSCSFSRSTITKEGNPKGIIGRPWIFIYLNTINSCNNLEN